MPSTQEKNLVPTSALDTLSHFGPTATSGAAEPAWLLARRRHALETFNRLGVPTRSHEDWKYTNPQFEALTALPRPAQNVDAAQYATELGRFDYLGETLADIVFIDGQFSAAASKLDNLPEGLELAPLSQLVRSEPERLELQLASRDHWAENEDAMASLNAAFFQDGAYLNLAAHVQVEGVVHILHLSTQNAEASNYPRNLIVIGENSSLRIAESYGELGECSMTKSNQVTEVYQGPSSRLDHYKIIKGSAATEHLSAQSFFQEEKSYCRSHTLILGGNLSRNQMDVRQGGDHSETDLRGVFVLDRDDHHDVCIKVNHSRSHCQSNQFFKGILDGNSSGVFNGVIGADEGTAGTDAHQTNKNLLLSDGAEMNTRPQLEIYTDDIQCSHGATVGELDTEALFYLRSRGIPMIQARDMLTRAFAMDVLEDIAVPQLKERFVTWLGNRLSRTWREGEGK